MIDIAIYESKCLKKCKKKEKYLEFTRAIAYSVIDYNYVRGTKIS